MSGSRPAAGERSRTGLDGLFAPRSLAVVGASAIESKWGYWLARGALAGRDRRDVYLVNRRGGALLGEPCFRSLAELPAAPELVVLATPPGQVLAAAGDALDAGARYLVTITGAVADGSGTGAAAERRLAELVRSRGARLLGPNCMGLVDHATALSLTWGELPLGQVALVSQSGAVGLELGRLLARAGLGFSRFVSVGNQRDVDAAEAVESLIGHEPTRLVAVYVEDFRDGRRMVDVLARLRHAGTPVLLLTVGGSEASGRAAASHTGALVSARLAVEAACRAAGALRADTPGQLVDAAQLLLAGAGPRGRRIAVVGDSGGQAAVAADVLTATGLEVPPLGPATVDALRAQLPPHAGVANPVDLAGAGEADLASYAAVTEVLLADPAVDLVALTGYFGDYATGTPGLQDAELAVAERLADVAARAGRPLIVHTLARDTPTVRALRGRGVAVYERIEQAAAAVDAALRWSAATPTPSATQGPKPAVERLDAGDYWSARGLLRGYGVRFPAAALANDADEAAKVAAKIGYPVVLKALGLAHKTEAGGVALGLRDEAALRGTYTTMDRRLAAGRYVVEAMEPARGGVELIMGVRRDRAFGPVGMVGLGGVTAELAPDVAVGLAPLTAEDALDLLRSLRGAALLQGWRGAPAVDLAAAAAVLAALSVAATEHPELSELEINPLLAHPDGAVALDAHAVLTPR